MTIQEINARNMMADAKYYEGYSRWSDVDNGYEPWWRAVERVMNMHREYYKDKMTDELDSLMNYAETLYKEKRVLGSQRALQFGGEQLLKHHFRQFNCTGSYCDRVEFFGELFYILLCGAGAGFSVQKHHVAKLPKIQARKKQAKTHVITDDIEGWATSLDVLLSSYFVNGGKHPEYQGRKVFFDSTRVREKNSHISGGFKAPGPEPLIKALNKVERLLEKILESGEDRLLPIHCYDICMYAADAVLSGGVRRSATICLFSIDDDDMLTAKTWENMKNNPQRARSNNSAMILRDYGNDELLYKLFTKLVDLNKKYGGEPGFYFCDSLEHCTNPCVEIGFYCYDENGKSGWEACNLTEINGALCTDEDLFYRACKASAILGTLQAGYTDFKFVSETTRKIIERESLLGCSITGWMNNPKVLLDTEVQKKGVAIIREINELVANLIGINPAARLTCSKPSGNASVILGCASNVSGEHSPYYLRHVQMNKEQEVAQAIKKINPYMVEESVWSTNKTDYVIAFPVIAPKQSIFKDDIGAIEFLEIVKKIQQNWVELGTIKERCVDPTVRHNVSNTVYIKSHEWDDVVNYIFENRQYFTGIAMLGATGDKDYNQAPFTSVLMPEQLIEKYGKGAIFASGLIVDSNTGFENLWNACRIAMEDSPDSCQDDLDHQQEWIRKFRKFSTNYFDGDFEKTAMCLKDVHCLHKWTKIQQNFVDIDFREILTEKKFIDIDTMGAIACSGGACELL